MKRCHDYFAVSNILVILGAALVLIVSGCGELSTSQQGSTANTTSVEKETSIATGNDVSGLPLKGKLKLDAAPDKAVIGMIYFNTSDKIEYIFDGSQWVPHDNSVDNFYKRKIQEKTVSYMGGPYSSGHVPHNSYTCDDCHRTVNMVVYFFDLPSSRAYIKPTPTNPNPPMPVYNGNMFDATKTKTCSNIACHGIAAGTFSYYFQGGDGEPELNTITYDGSVAVTPPWNSSSAACTACHGNPPNSNAWHSGYHGGQGPTGAYNQCQFCHPDATSTNGHGTSITKPLLHNDGVINVQVTYKSTCFGCH
jgi:predicted CxxxxCH...CXXCH cytochrome family protein